MNYPIAIQFADYLPSERKPNIEVEGTSALRLTLCNNGGISIKEVERAFREIDNAGVRLEKAIVGGQGQ